MMMASRRARATRAFRIVESLPIRSAQFLSAQPECLKSDLMLTNAFRTRKQRVTDKAGTVVQVGYMKRFDQSYEKLLSLLPKDARELRMISVEVQDPDSWPFNQHQGDFVKTADIPADIVAEGKRRRDKQVTRAVGRDLTGAEMWGYTNSYCSSLIHDINVVHGILDALGIETGEVIGAAFFAGGDGGHGTVRL